MDRNGPDGAHSADGRHLGAGLLPGPHQAQAAGLGPGQMLHRQGPGGAGPEAGDPGSIHIRQFQARRRIVEQQFALDREAAVTRVFGKVTVPLDPANMVTGKRNLPEHGLETAPGQDQMDLRRHIYPTLAVGPKGFGHCGQGQIHVQDSPDFQIAQ